MTTPGKTRLLSHLLTLACVTWTAGNSSEAMALEPLSDEQLSEYHGQAIFRTVTTQGDGAGNGSSDLQFTRWELGAEIEINANFEKIEVGHYPRNFQACGSTRCTPADRFSESFEDYYQASEQDLPGRSDLLFRNYSLGYIENPLSAQPILHTMKMSFPYIEFAYRDANNAQSRELVGMRVGFMDTDGMQGAFYDGPDRPDPDFDGGFLSISGDLELDVQFLGLGLGTAVNNAPRASFLEVTGLASLTGNKKPTSLTGQLPIENSENFYISLANEALVYPRFGGGVNRTAQAGAWMNLVDGLSVGVIDGLTGNTKISNCFNGNLGTCFN